MTRPVLQGGTVTIKRDTLRYASVPVHAISLPDNYCGMDMDQVGRYIELLKSGYDLEPVLLFDDTEADRYWIIDGRHRFFSYVAVGHSTIPAFYSSDVEIVN